MTQNLAEQIRTNDDLQKVSLHDLAWALVGRISQTENGTTLQVRQHAQCRVDAIEVELKRRDAAAQLAEKYQADHAAHVERLEALHRASIEELGWFIDRISFAGLRYRQGELNDCTATFELWAGGYGSDEHGSKCCQDALSKLKAFVASSNVEAALNQARTGP